MTDRAALLALAKRCEQAAGPDRELDNAILIALGYSWRGMAYLHDDDNHVLKGSTFFTKILDAAVTLVPEGCDWHCQSNPSVSACWASVSPMKFDSKLQEWGSGMRRASTPALALCAAALRARAMAQPSSET